MKIADVLSLIDNGVIALAEFQRGYVWNRDQVRRLMGSLYRGHPVGSLLVWVTKSGVAKTRGSDAGFGTVELLLDGQQRITTLYGVIRGKPPKFFQGDEKAFLDLYFNVADETFEFYGPVKMQDNPLWVSVTRVMEKGAVACVNPFYGHPEHSGDFGLYLNRLNALEKIKDREVHAEKITGEDKTIDVVVDIFNEINSGGTKLSKGDLALAKICAEWPDARDEMRKCLSFWRQRGFDFELDWLLRNVTAVSTGQAMFAGLKDVDASKFQQDLAITEKAINSILNLVSGRLGLDHDRVLAGRYAFPVMCRYLVQRGGKLNTKLDQDRILFWYIQSFMWGRYAGSTETILNQDLAPLGDLDHAFDQLIKQLRVVRGDLTVRSDDFGGWSTGARFYPMLYLLTRVMGARDWGNGLPLSANLLGKLNSLQVHHIFPKAQLYKGGFHKRGDIAGFLEIWERLALKTGDISAAAKREDAYAFAYALLASGVFLHDWRDCLRSQVGVRYILTPEGQKAVVVDPELKALGFDLDQATVNRNPLAAEVKFPNGRSLPPGFAMRCTIDTWLGRWCPRPIWNVVEGAIERDEAFSVFREAFLRGTEPEALDCVVEREQKIEQSLVELGFVMTDDERLQRWRQKVEVLRESETRLSRIYLRFEPFDLPYDYQAHKEIEDLRDNLFQSVAIRRKQSLAARKLLEAEKYGNLSALELTDDERCGLEELLAE